MSEDLQKIPDEQQNEPCENAEPVSGGTILVVVIITFAIVLVLCGAVAAGFGMHRVYKAGKQVEHFLLQVMESEAVSEMSLYSGQYLTLCCMLCCGFFIPGLHLVWIVLGIQALLGEDPATVKIQEIIQNCPKISCAHTNLAEAVVVPEFSKR